MGDDLDDLLDEIESTFTCPQHPVLPVRTEVKSPSSDMSDLDRIISDICSEDDPDIIRHSKPGRSLKQSSKQSTTAIDNRLKCTTLLLGGSRIAMGLCDRQKQRSCDKLRCVSCDFRVVWFNDYMWHSRSEYLFFRNNVPDFEKLKRNLVKKRGSRAYACQCSWESVDGLVEVDTRTKLKWVCGKH